MKRILFFLCWMSITSISGYCQPVDFSLSLEVMDEHSLPGIHSYAFATTDQYWLIIGGRTDGLHRRQPWAAFDGAGRNHELIVIDTESWDVYRQSLENLHRGLRDQLTSTNMEFYQDGAMLYLIGGYGIDTQSGDHKTFGRLITAEAAEIATAVVEGKDLSPYFHTIEDPVFQVTGGRLDKIGDRFYLVGGQNFDGVYNPMGPNHGPGFTQTYTEAVRIFTVSNQDGKWTFELIDQFEDEHAMHRRDFNVVPQIFPKGLRGLTAFAGVFQKEKDLPFLTAVDISPEGFMQESDFKQRYNHYHCPTLPMYDAQTNTMHTAFFGGMAQFYDSLGWLVQDDNVPFVRTIAVVSRDQNGVLHETRLEVEMPNFLGAGAEFIVNEDLPRYENGVIRLDALPEEKVLLGYIYGGILSSAPNIFWSNDGSQSTAYANLIAVYLEDTPSNVEEISAVKQQRDLSLEVYPNPAHGLINLDFNLKTKGDVKISILDEAGRILSSEYIIGLNPGPQTYQKRVDGLVFGGTYVVLVESQDGNAKRIVYVEK